MSDYTLGTRKGESSDNSDSVPAESGRLHTLKALLADKEVQHAWKYITK